MTTGGRARILLATSYRIERDFGYEEICLPADYVAAIAAAGGDPILVPPMAEGPAWDDLAAMGDGLLLAGGPDLDPASYGQERHPKTVMTLALRQAADARLFGAAEARGLPVLGICLGIQTLNVLRGGTLHQHVPDRFGDAVAHHRAAGDERPRHAVRIEAGSRLAGIVGGETVSANSSHHQSLDRVGSDLRAVAWSQDGVVEAVEDPRPGRFVVGVQWHPEELYREAPHLALFEALVEAARARR